MNRATHRSAGGIGLPPGPSWRCNARSCLWSPQEPTAIYGLPKVQLADHAAHSGHPLCRTCSRSLDEHEQNTCEHCLSKVRRDLKRIVELYALLPVQLGQIRGRGLDAGRGGDRHPLPGGRALVLLSPGSDGGAARRLTSSEEQKLANDEPVRWWLLRQVGPLTAAAYRELEQAAQGREHAADNKPDDCTSAVRILQQWVRDWRTVHGEPDDDVPTMPLTTAAGYLEVNMRWAATSHDEFPTFAAELRALVNELKAAHDLQDTPLRAHTECLDCGDALVVAYRRPDRCLHQRPAFPSATEVVRDRDGNAILDRDKDGNVILDEETGDPVVRTLTRTLADRRRIHAWLLEQFDAVHKGCDQGGLKNTWSCRGCHRTYDEKEYRLAAGQQMYADRSPDRIGTARQLAEAVSTIDDRPLRPSTIRTWEARGRLQSVGVNRDGHKTYRLADVLDLYDGTTPRHADTPLQRVSDDRL